MTRKSLPTAKRSSWRAWLLAAAIACDAYEPSLAERPDEREARMNYVHALSEIGQHADAAAQIDLLSPDVETDGDLVLFKGKLPSWSARYDEALSTLDSLLAYDPNNTAAHSARAFTLLWAGRAEDAIRQFDKVLELAPGDEEALKGREQAVERFTNQQVVENARLHESADCILVAPIDDSGSGNGRLLHCYRT